MVACALRNNGAGSNYWQPIDDASHESQWIDSVTTDGTEITVNYASAAAAKVVSMTVVPDEALAQQGVVAGASVGLTEARIRMTYQVPTYADYISWSGSAFVTSYGVFTVSSYTAGVLTLTHTAFNSLVPLGRYFDISMQGRGGIAQPWLSNAGGAVTNNTLKIEFRDMAGVLLTVGSADMKVALTTGGGITTVDPRLVDTSLFPLSNLWVYGVLKK